MSLRVVFCLVGAGRKGDACTYCALTVISCVRTSKSVVETLPKKKKKEGVVEAIILVG